MSTREREKLSDTFSAGEPLLGSKTNSFEVAYPSIASIRIEVLETEMMWPNEHGSWLLTEKNFRHAIDCSNSLCYGGGIEVGNILQDAISKQLTQFEEGGRCRGNEGSPKGRRIYRTCQHKFIVKGTIEYRQNPSAAG